MPSMLAGLNPGWVLIISGVASLFITMRQARQVVTIAAPLLALARLCARWRRHLRRRLR